MPLLLNSREYSRCLKLLEGKKKSQESLERIRGFFSSEFQARVLDFVVDKLDGMRRLYIVMKDSHSYNLMHDSAFHIDPKIDRRAREALPLSRSGKLLPPGSPSVEYILSFADFSYDYLNDITTRIFNEAKEELTTLAERGNVWDILPGFVNIVVFYETENDLTRNKASGLNEKLASRYYETLKKVDAFDILPPEGEYAIFDSKENLDENFQGSFYLYLR